VPQGNVVSDAILVLNTGSSSIKFSLFEGHERPGPKGLICEGQFDGIGHGVHFTAKDRSGRSRADSSLLETSTHESALAKLLDWLERQFPGEPLVAAGQSRGTWRIALCLCDN
jgi:acetate kinase